MVHKLVVFRFKFFVFVVLLSGFLGANASLYQMMPGSYKMDVVVTDSEESYPVKLAFDINDNGYVNSGKINYPTYDCIANIKSSIQSPYQLTMFEKMTFGHDTCEDGKYDIFINKSRLYSPSSSRYFILKTYDSGNSVDIRVKSYRYYPSKYAKLRIKNKIKNLDELLNSKNSSNIRKYIKYSKDDESKQLANQKLKQLIAVENSEFNKIKHSRQIADFRRYILSYPGSSHVAKAKNTIAAIKKAILIASYRKKATPESYYKAYRLSNDKNDVEKILLQMRNLSGLDKYMTKHSDLKSLKLVSDKYVFFYRKEKSFNGFMSAYEITHSRRDIQNAYKLAKTVPEKRIIEIALFKYFGKSKFLNVQIGKSSESTLKELKSSSFLTSFRGMGKDYYKTINVALDKNQGIKFQYAKYKVKLKIKLDLDYTPHINGKGKDYSTRSISVVLNNANIYNKKELVVFSNIPVQGEYHMAAIRGLKFLAGLMGQDTSKLSEEIPVQLNKAVVKYEIISIEAF